MKFYLILAVSCFLAVQARKDPKCVRAQTEAATTGERAPTCTSNGKFERKQCDDTKCWCVKGRSGKNAYKGQEVPLGEDYDCKKKPKTCQVARFDAIFAGASQVPECDGSGRFTTQQCTGGDSTENLALGKDTFTIGVTHGGNPARAVDGDRSALWQQNSCTHSPGVTNPWWAVDLGSSQQLSQVVITNREACCHERLGNVRIGTTNVSPATTAPSPNNYDLCASTDGHLGDGETRAFECTTKGRYVVVQLERTAGILTLCEVEVYGSSKECWCVKPKSGKEISGSRKDGDAQC